MSESLDIARIRAREFSKEIPSWKAMELIFQVRAKYDIIYLNKIKNDNQTRTENTLIIDGMEDR